MKHVFRPFTRVPDPNHKWFEDKTAYCYRVQYRLVPTQQLRKGGFLFTDDYKEAKWVAKEQGCEVWERVEWWDREDSNLRPGGYEPPALTN